MLVYPGASAILWQIFLIPKQIQEECAMQAKAAVLYEAGTPLRLEEVEVLPPNAVKSRSACMQAACVIATCM